MIDLIDLPAFSSSPMCLTTRDLVAVLDTSTVWRTSARESGFVVVPHLDVLAFEHHPRVGAGHLVHRVPVRPDAQVQHAGVEHVVGVLPTDRLGNLDGGAGPVGAVAGGERGPEDACGPARRSDPRTSTARAPAGDRPGSPSARGTCLVRLLDLAAHHQRQPVVEPLLERGVGRARGSPSAQCATGAAGAPENAML